jgi:hypothetical protein
MPIGADSLFRGIIWDYIKMKIRVDRCPNWVKYSFTLSCQLGIPFCYVEITFRKVFHFILWSARSIQPVYRFFNFLLFIASHWLLFLRQIVLFLITAIEII